MLFVHAVTWFGVSYLDQSYVVWLMQLAALSAATQATALRACERPATADGAGVRVESAAPSFARTRGAVIGNATGFPPGRPLFRAFDARRGRTALNKMTTVVIGGDICPIGANASYFQSR